VEGRIGETAEGKRTEPVVASISIWVLPVHCRLNRFRLRWQTLIVCR
jgi:hypothetical protein